MKEVQVLLSSYNGEKYINEQIDSILTQDQVKVRLLIRDDGSTDGTKVILQQYEARYENVRVIFGENLGVIKSFFALLEEADSEVAYIALADQDDVWLPQKLHRAISMLGEQSGYENASPLVYCSAKQLVDARLNPLTSALKFSHVRPCFGNALVENMCTGCTCVFNATLLKLLKGREPEFTVMHDFWIYLVGSCFGQVFYDEESYILYRQHGNNELGEASSLFENYRRRVKNFKKHRGQLTRQAEELLRLFGDEIPGEEKRLAEEFVLGKVCLKVRKKLLKEKKVFRQRTTDNLIFCLLMQMGQL